MEFNWIEVGGKVGLFFIPFLFALCFHEYAHGWVARLKGDRTAEMMGRLSMNPLVHMDVLGTVILPMAAILTGYPFFGWAKPVPVNERNLKNPVKDMFWIALAGPMSNVLLAVISTLLLTIILVAFRSPTGNAVMQILNMFIQINLFLAIFNLIPLHPLDGGKIAARFLPYSANRFLEEHQMTLSYGLLILVLIGGLKFLALPVMWLYTILQIFAHSLAQILA